MKVFRVLWGVFFALAILTLVVSVALLGWCFFLGGMAKVTAWYLFQVVPPVFGLAMLILVGVQVAVLRSFSIPMRILTGISLLAMAPALLMVFPVTYPASLENMHPAVTVRLPADVPLRVGWGGDHIKVNYHACVPDQRWAYDLMADPCLTESANLEDYGIYGVPLRAPAAGEIVVAHDGEPDMKPGVISKNLESPLGNHIVIRLATGTYLILAHLKPGSVIVKAGDTVAEGQEIGACGNSGNTSEPHIHIHHQRQDPRKYPLNFAEGLPLYFRDHDGPAMPTGGFEMKNGKPVLLGPTVRHVGK